MSGVHGLATTFGRIPFRNHTSTTMIKGEPSLSIVLLLYCTVLYCMHLSFVHSILLLTERKSGFIYICEATFHRCTKKYLFLHVLIHNYIHTYFGKCILCLLLFFTFYIVFRWATGSQLPGRRADLRRHRAQRPELLLRQALRRRGARTSRAAPIGVFRNSGTIFFVRTISAQFL